MLATACQVPPARRSLPHHGACRYLCAMWPLLMIVTGYLAWLVFCLRSLRLFYGALLRGARHTLAFLAADAKEPDLGKKVPASNLGRKPDLSEKVTTSNLGRKPDLTEKVASTSEGVAIFTEDNRNGSRPSRFPTTNVSDQRLRHRLSRQRTWRGPWKEPANRDFWNRRTGTPPSGATSSNLTGTPPSSRPGGGIEMAPLR